MESTEAEEKRNKKYLQQPKIIPWILFFFHQSFPAVFQTNNCKQIFP